MGRPVVFMYSGQGSQYYHMGAQLYETHPGFRRWMDKIDRTGVKHLKRSVVSTIFDKTKSINDRFVRLADTSVAILAVEYALSQVMMEQGVTPDFLLGSSMGELTASLVGGVLGLEELMADLSKRVTIFEDRIVDGTMIGILENVKLYRECPELFERSEVAAVNLDSHFVVSCEARSLPEIESFLQKKGILFQRVQVAKPFHSSLLDGVERSYKDVGIERRYAESTIPIVSCARGAVVDEFDENYYWDVYRNPIQTQKTVREMERNGSYVYIDLGPSGTLSNFVKHNLEPGSKSVVFPVLTPFGKDLKNFQEVQKFFIKTQEEETVVQKRARRAFLFPGQGSQIKGMGQGLFDEFPEFVAIADECLGYSIEELCLENPEGRLKWTQYTQPALYVVNALSYYRKLKTTGEKPDYVAGHSLGEFNALLAAGAFDFKTGLEMVKMRGELMSQAPGGAMAAVVDLSSARIEEILRDNGLSSIDVANYNAPLQTVISGLKDVIGTIQHIFEKEGATYIPLRVSAAFHSRYMQEAKEKFEQYLSRQTFSELTIPVVSNVGARPYRRETIRESLAEQLRSAVRWTESIQYLIAQGVTEFEEVGPGNVLTKLTAKIREAAESHGEVEEAKEPGRATWQTLTATARQRVQEWNAAHPRETRVKVNGYAEEFVTRTEAMVLFGHQAAIYVEGCGGFFPLEEIRAV